jgi:curved DNA-binding protein CbpA
MATIDFYAVLELPVTATDEDVRRAYRRLAVRWHPDKNPEDLITAERRFKEVAEAYEVLRDPMKRRQYDRVRAGHARPRRTTSWFGSTDGFGDDLWHDDGWGGSGPGWAFRNPFDVFKEFFGDRDPWADMTPRTRRQGSSFWSVSSEPFFSSRPFSSPFFNSSRRNGSLFDLLDQRGDTAPAPPPMQPERTTRVEIKIHGFSDSEDSSSDDDEEGEVVVEQVVDDEDADGEAVEEDAALKEAIRLSLEQENERKRNEQRAAEETEEDLEEAIRRSLADLEQQGQQRRAPTSGDWMDVEEELDDDDKQRQRYRSRPVSSE